MTITLYELPALAARAQSAPARGRARHSAEQGAGDPRIGETRSPDYLAKNPNGKVPTLVEDDFVLWESPAILKYLAAKHPER